MVPTLTVVALTVVALRWGVANRIASLHEPPERSIDLHAGHTVLQRQEDRPRAARIDCADVEDLKIKDELPFSENQMPDDRACGGVLIAVRKRQISRTSGVWRTANFTPSGFSEVRPRSGAGPSRASGPRFHRPDLGRDLHGARPERANATDRLPRAEPLAAGQVAREQGARAPEATPAVDRRRFARRQGSGDGLHAALDLSGRGGGEVLHRQVDLPQPLAAETVRVVGPLVKVDQQPHTAARERGQGPVRARVGAPEHAWGDPAPPIGQAQEGAEGDPRLRQAAPSRREPPSSGMRPIRHRQTVPPGHLDGNRGPPRILFTRVRGRGVPGFSR